MSVKAQSYSYNPPYRTYTDCGSGTEQLGKLNYSSCSIASGWDTYKLGQVHCALWSYSSGRITIRVQKCSGYFVNGNSGKVIIRTSEDAVYCSNFTISDNYTDYVTATWNYGEIQSSEHFQVYLITSDQVYKFYAGLITITASYTISASASPSSGGSVSGGGDYSYNSYCYLSASASSGYSFVRWKKGSSTVSTNPNYNFRVTGDASYVAEFEANTYTISASASPSAGGSVSGAGTYNQGSTCTLHAYPNTGYSFVRWTKNGSQVSTSSTYSFTVNGDASYVAVFQLNSYTISASASPSAGGSVSGAGSFNYGSSCTLTATPNTGYSFVRWTKNGSQVSTNLSYSFTVTESASYVAVFQLNSYTISASASPSSGGSVSGAGSYNHGSSCTLTATPNTGYSFVRWTKNGSQVSTSSSYSFTVTGSASYVAVFQQNSYTISASASPSAGGSVSGTGTYTHGSSCSMMATANLGYDFINWTENGSVVSTNPTYHFTVTGNRTLVANFEISAPATYFIPQGEGFEDNMTLTGVILIDGVEQTSTSLELGAFCNGQCRGSVCPVFFQATQRYLALITIFGENGDELTFKLYDHDQEMELDLLSPEGVVFGTNSYGSLMDPFVLNFTTPIVEYSVTATASPSAGGTVSGAGTYQEGQSCTLTATPNAGYTFVRWTKNGSQVSTNPSYTFVVSDNASYVAHFSLNSYGITVTASPAEGGTVTGVGNYSYGSTVTLTATPNAGYTFVRWTRNGQAVSTNPTYLFTVTGNATFVAEFSLNSFSITASANPSEGGSVSGAGTYQEGQSCTLTATPNDGYTFVRWTKNGSLVSTNPNYTFIETGNANYVAEFSPVSYPLKHWHLNGYYPSWDPLNMIAEIVINVDGVELANPDIEVAAFIGETLMSNGEFPIVQSSGRYVYFMTLNGFATPSNANFHNRLTFKLYDHSTETELDYMTPVEIIYSTNWDIGSASNPFVVSFFTNENELAWTKVTAADLKSGDVIVIGGSQSDYVISREKGNVGGAYDIERVGKTITFVEPSSAASWYRKAPQKFVVYKNAFANSNDAVALFAHSGYLRTPEKDPEDELDYNEFDLWPSLNITNSQPELNAYWSVAINGGNASITAIGDNPYNTMRFKADEGVFACFPSVSEEPLCIYRLGERGDDPVEESHWTPQSEGFEDNMTLTGVIQIDGVEQTSTSLELGAFCNGQCRGSVRPVFFPATQRYLAMITIFGENGDELTFKLYDHDQEMELDLVSPEGVIFGANSYGSLMNPYVLNFTNQGPSYHWTPVITGDDSGMSMTMVSVVRIDLVEQQVNTLEVGAFSNDVCKGSSMLEYDESLGRYLAFLSIRGRNGNELAFRLYDHATGTELDLICATELTYLDNAHYGSLSEPYPIDFVTDVSEPATFTRTLDEGWNWLSFNLKLDADLLEGLKSAIAEECSTAMIKTQNNGFLNYANGTWTGTFSQVSNDVMLLICLDHEVNLNLEGVTANPLLHTVTLTSGWNWIGYVEQTRLSLSAAFSNMVPEDGDMVKSLNSFSIYNASTGIWSGNLKYLEPGYGYIYQSNRTGNIEFVYPAIQGNSADDVDDNNK